MKTIENWVSVYKVNCLRTDIKMRLLVGLLCIILVSGVPHFQQELPESWQDEWILSLTDSTLKIGPTFIDDFFVLEIQTFLNEFNVISADGNRRCNICHVFTELHQNILTLQMSDCQSQVNRNLGRI